MGFKPYGTQACKMGKVSLKYEEFESIRFINYDGLSQNEAAKLMNISRPTFTRIHNHALKVVAKALVECKLIEIDGGTFSFEQEWYRCKKCFKLIQGLENHVKCKNCPVWGENELIRLNNIC